MHPVEPFWKDARRQPVFFMWCSNSYSIIVTKAEVFCLYKRGKSEMMEGKGRQTDKSFRNSDDNR